MKVYTNTQARNYLDKVASGQPVKPNVSGFFWSDIEKGWLTFKGGSVLEFFIEPTEQAALNRLMKTTIIILAFTALIGCADKTRYCECTTTVTAGEVVTFTETSVIQYQGTKNECINSFVVDSYGQEIKVICNPSDGGITSPRVTR